MTPPFRFRGRVARVASYRFADGHHCHGVVVLAFDGERFSSRAWEDLRRAHGVGENVPIPL